jgi:HD-like signal output (HDOD) protein
MDMLDLYSRVFAKYSPATNEESRKSADNSRTLVTPSAEPTAILPEPDVQGWWVPEGDMPVLTAPPLAPNGSIDGELYDQLVGVLDDPNLGLPRLPQVAQRALILLHDPDVDFKQLAKLIGQDPSTAAEVLRVANSVAYCGVDKIVRLHLAFARIGCRTLRSIFLAISVKGLLIQVGGPERSRGEELWQRALVSGIVAEQFSDPRILVPDEAFLVGLLHDLGSLAILKVLHDYQLESKRRISRSLFDRLCGGWHEHIGLRLANAWNLPDPLPEIIGNHHHEPADDDPLNHHRTLVQFADAVCAMLGYAPYVPYDFFALPCVRRLGLTNNPVTCERLRGLLDVVAERIQSL